MCGNYDVVMTEMQVLVRLHQGLVFSPYLFVLIMDNLNIGIEDEVL